MPYSITTKDGITINNIPDDIEPNAQVLKDRVASIRAQSGGEPQAVTPPVQAVQPPPAEPAQQTQLPVEEAGFLDQALGGLENVASLASGIVAEPLAGLAGIGAQIGEATGLADEGAATQ